MKMFFYLVAFVLIAATSVNAQTKKDGTLDMRYNVNKQTQFNTYTVPTNTYTVPSTTTNTSVQYQSGYTKSNGVVVQPYYKTTSNATNTDNFSTTPNTNPYTGQTGTRAQDYTPAASNYGKGQTIQTGTNGGQYYINGNGNKTYVPKR